MNTKIEILKVAEETLKAKRFAAREVIKAGVLAVMKARLADIQNSGVPTAYINEERFDIEHPNIFVERNGKRDWCGHCIDVYYRDDSYGREGGTRKLEINVSACGTFGADNKELVAYYSVVGYMTRNLAAIEAELAALDWKSYDEAVRLHADANWELEKAEREEKAAADAKLAAEFEAKLVAGARVQVGIDKTAIKRDENGRAVMGDNGLFIHEEKAIIRKLDKVTAKMVYWTNECPFYAYTGQDKKAEIIAKLVSGEYKLVG